MSSFELFRDTLAGRFRDERAAGGAVAGPQLVVLRRIDSTNTLGRRLHDRLSAEDQSLSPTLLVAWQQVAGRGRQGRVWDSGAGLGVWTSLACVIGQPEQLSLLPLSVSVTIARVLGRYTRRPVRLKWPNDVVCEGRKLAGILIESVASTSGQGVVIGYGVNHGHTPEQLPLASAVSLRLVCATLPTLATVAFELGSRVSHEISSPRPGSAIVEDYRALSVHQPGDRLRFRVGGEELDGTFLGIEASGHLRLATTDGERVLAAGEVIEAPSAPTSGHELPT